jgi:hypothetical protein
MGNKDFNFMIFTFRVTAPSADAPPFHFLIRAGHAAAGDNRRP